jgi:TatD DNase family protein
MPKLIDTHSHLHFPRFDEARTQALERMQREDIWTITVSTTMKNGPGAVELADSSDLVWASLGYHPYHFTNAREEPDEGAPGEYSIAEIERLARSSKRVVAIGETGIDFHHVDKKWTLEQALKLQKDPFVEQIKLAEKLNLAVIIHCRDAFPQLIEAIQELKAACTKIRGVVHCFGESWEVAKPLLDLGLLISFTGTITFPVRKKDDPERHVHRVVEKMPLERIMIETDAPWLAPEAHRGERNEPVFVEEVAKKIAELRGLTFDQVAKQTTQTAREFFRI